MAFGLAVVIAGCTKVERGGERSSAARATEEAGVADPQISSEKRIAEPGEEDHSRGGDGEALVRLKPAPQRKRSPPPKMDEPSSKSSKAAGTNMQEQSKITAVAAQIRFAEIPAGSFRRGSTPEQHASLSRQGANLDPLTVEDEFPARTVVISRPFEMALTEVTQTQFEQVMGKNPSRKTGPDLPVTNVRFADAVEFCKRLSAATGRTHRLPTEAEWEYACRAGTETIWHFGDVMEKIDAFAWHEGNSGSKVHPVGQRKPNSFGLFDMYGNVWEWCSDWFSPNYYAIGPDVDPPGPQEGEGRVVRGGSAFDEPWMCRSAERDFGPPVPGVNLGFRIVREIADR